MKLIPLYVAWMLYLIQQYKYVCVYTVNCSYRINILLHRQTAYTFGCVEVQNVTYVTYLIACFCLFYDDEI